MGDISHGCFGENLFVDGGEDFNMRTVCVGDVFGVCLSLLCLSVHALLCPAIVSMIIVMPF